MSDCNRCLWATRNGSCASWDCRFVDQREAYEAYNREKADTNQWIPISVKLPEKRQDVIVTVNDGAIYTDTDEWIGTGFFAYGHNVVAWQSLPDPWKGAEQ